jgi:hypothetical protein
MDADDVSLLWRFALQRAYLERNSLDVAFSTVLMQTIGRAAITSQRLAGVSPEAAPLQLLLSNPFVHSTMFGLRAAIETASGYRNVPSEDYDLWMRMAERGARLGRHPIPTLLYRFHPNQVTASSQWKKTSNRSELTASAHASLARCLLQFESPVFGRLRGAPEDRESEANIGHLLRQIELQGVTLPKSEQKRLGRMAMKVRQQLRLSSEVRS